MKLLLDTHYFIWLVSNPVRLSRQMSEALSDPANTLFVSSVCVWEVAIKNALGRIIFPMQRMDAAIAESGFAPLAITHTHAMAAGALPRLHQDPFDRMLVAQARCEGLTLVTQDRTLRQYDVPVLPAR